MYLNMRFTLYNIVVGRKFVTNEQKGSLTIFSVSRLCMGYKNYVQQITEEKFKIKTRQRKCIIFSHLCNNICSQCNNHLFHVKNSAYILNVMKLHLALIQKSSRHLLLQYRYYSSLSTSFIKENYKLHFMASRSTTSSPGVGNGQPSP